jgi:outer membrane immunogenic protein
MRWTVTTVFCSRILALLLVANSAQASDNGDYSAAKSNDELFERFLDWQHGQPKGAQRHVMTDQSRKARAEMPPPAPPPMTWTGCYVGGNIGGAFGSASLSGAGGGDVSGDGSGFAGGGQIGCDYQFSGGWVIGFRDMFDGTSNKKSGTITTGLLAGNVANFNNQWFDTLTARIGYAVVPDWLLYFQGGGAWGHTSTNITAAGVQIAQTSNTRTGWTIGGGVEWMFAPHWSAFLEGNYMDFGSTSGTAFTPVGTACVAGCAFSAKLTESTVLVGVNYRFR